MIKNYKIVDGEYIVAIGFGKPTPGGKVIDAKEFDTIYEVLSNRPIAPNGCGYKLKVDLTWELYILPETGDELGVTERLAALEDELAATKILLGVDV